MKKVIMLLAVVGLTGCSTLYKIMPTKYDPVLGGNYIELQIEVDELDCTDINGQFDMAAVDAKKLAEYSKFRNDPQLDNVVGIQSNLEKASNAKSKAVCDNYLKLAKLRLQVVRQAWSGRFL